jgi:hypothetical protein
VHLRLTRSRDGMDQRRLHRRPSALHEHTRMAAEFQAIRIARRAGIGAAVGVRLVDVRVGSDQHIRSEGVSPAFFFQKCPSARRPRHETKHTPRLGIT